MSEDNNLFPQAVACLKIKHPEQKVDAVYDLQKRWNNGGLLLERLPEVVSLPVPGRPGRAGLCEP